MQIDLLEVQKILEWVKIKLYLNTRASSAASRIIKRGQVYRCNFGCGVGSEIQKDRPAVIIQNDIANKRSGNTIVIPITHDNSSLPCMAPLTPQYDANGATVLDGQANTSNLMCVSKARLGDLLCSLPNSDMKKIDEALAKSVGLMTYYADLEAKLDDKLTYIEKIKTQRNANQDKLSEINQLMSLSNKGDPGEILADIQKILDNKT